MNEIKLFENSQIRSVWDSEKEEWFFSVVDIIEVLTQSSNPRRYWSDLKRKIKDEEGGIELYEKIVQLKLKPQTEKCGKPMPRIYKAFSVLFSLCQARKPSR